MRQAQALFLVGTLSTGAVAAASLPRGVGPEFSKYFESKDTFACIGHPSIVLQVSQVNDDSCDCPDGSDEPGTSACSFIDPLSPPQPLPGSPSGTTNTTNALPGFWCPNAGHVGSYVPFSFINDGVCDYDLCCDGSDEYAHKGGVKCENRCAAIGKEYRRVEEERRQSWERAIKRRRTLAKEARELRRQVEARVVKLRAEVAELEAKQERLKKDLAETERIEKGRAGRASKAGGKLSTLVGVTKKRIGELRDTLDKVLGHRNDLQDKVAELEDILRKLQTDYNPNFNDEGVKAAVHAWEDYAAKTADEKKPEVDEIDVYAVLRDDGDNNIPWQDFEGADADAEACGFESFFPGPVRDLVSDKLMSARIWLIDNGLLADNSDGSESAAVQKARKALRDAENELNTPRRSLRKDEEDLEQDYGPDGIFRAARDRCASLDVGEYEYEFCWLGQTSQKSKKGHGNTNMGKYAGFEMAMADEEERVDGKSLGSGLRYVLKYDNGQQCWNGPRRQTNVWLGCAEKEELWRVSESEKCIYRMEVGTPFACEEIKEEASGKDEL